jgi:hypothetical protein
MPLRLNEQKCGCAPAGGGDGDVRPRAAQATRAKEQVRDLLRWIIISIFIHSIYKYINGMIMVCTDRRRMQL